MPHRKIAFSFLFAGITLLLITGIYLATALPAHAQCGSQASSCKNCHEVQGEMPVNADGTGWHESHAFGDFCYICHGGNQQATEEAAAHEGMGAPLSDVQAACQQCHVADLQERAQVYAAALGIEVGSGSEASVPESSETTPTDTESASSTTSSQDCEQIVVDDPNLVNYAQNYDEIVLGEKPINWGNTILMVMIGVLAVGGGGFVATREKLIHVSFGNTSQVEGEYPADVVEMLPQIASLKARTRRSLKTLLDQPQKADKVLELIHAVLTDETAEE